MRRMLVCAVFLLAGCRDATAPHTDLLRVFALGERVHLSNLTAEPVYFVVIERVYSATALMALCADPSACPRVGPRQKLSLPYAAIVGYAPGSREAIVLHWRLIPKSPDGWMPDSVRAIVTQLH